MNINKRHRDLRFEAQTREADLEGGAKGLYVEGYAALYGTETTLFRMFDIDIKEEIAPGAFDGTKMDDVIMNYNHEGKVVARTRNSTLELSVDEKGLFVRARLDGTEEGRRLYDEIKGGYITQMSFRFTIEKEAYDEIAHKYTVERIGRLYDVSAVDIPAYEDTYLEARRAERLEAVAQAERQAAEAATYALELKKRRAELLLRL
jgi:HK97 family phage prohead protease